MLQNRIQNLRNEYPSQFWLLFWGMLISTTGASMIWPFLMIYASERLDQPLAVVGSLLTVNSIMGLIFAFVAGPVTDRVGRKWVMVISLVVNAIYYLLLGRAATLPAFYGLMMLSGAFNPLYRVGADAMMADLIPAQKRTDAYALLRMSNNVGVALGPAIGGVIATISYSTAFLIAAVGMILYSLLIAFLARETLPARPASEPRPVERFGGYGRVIRDRQFVYLIANFTLTSVVTAIIWVLLGVYSKQHFGVSESLYGLIPTTNALMVVFLQVWVTSRTKRRPPLMAMTVGSLFYALASGGIALGQGFWAFWASMVVMTVGELILVPTATTLAANMAPADMRGRYMSVYGLTWGVAAGIGPVLGGLLNDRVGPAAIWWGGLLVGMVSTLFFLIMARRTRWEAAPVPGD